MFKIKAMYSIYYHCLDKTSSVYILTYKIYVCYTCFTDHSPQLQIQRAWIINLNLLRKLKVWKLSHLYIKERLEPPRITTKVLRAHRWNMGKPNGKVEFENEFKKIPLCHGWANFSTKRPCFRVLYRIRPQSGVGLRIRAMRVLYALQSGCGPLWSGQHVRTNQARSFD